jgi:hypothetical protein
LRAIAKTPMRPERAASAIQTRIQASMVAWRPATNAAPRAVSPITTRPTPGTAVKGPARSSVSRMKRKLSRANSRWTREGRRSGTRMDGPEPGPGREGAVVTLPGAGSPASTASSTRLAPERRWWPEER